MIGSFGKERAAFDGSLMDTHALPGSLPEAL